jgi:hypothetical protein
LRQFPSAAAQAPEPKTESFPRFVEMFSTYCSR